MRESSYQAGGGLFKTLTHFVFALLNANTTFSAKKSLLLGRFYLREASGLWIVFSDDIPVHFLSDIGLARSWPC